jgi:RNA polymerase sigma-70 factor (ECF subfamily)
MLRFQKGDEEAFAGLVDRHRRTVLNLVIHFVGPVADAEDLAQDVFVRLFQARKTYRPEAKFTTFLYRNTLNLCLNYLRDRKHRRTLSLDAAPGEEGARLEVADAAAVPPGAALEERERAEAVRRALDRLPENQRTAVLLLRWKEWSYQEIAETMDLSVMAVKSLLSRAKENLRESLSRLLADGDAAPGAKDEGGP